MHQKENCIFCQILQGAAPASFVHRDEVCAAFMDIAPVNPGHLLVIPLRHAAALSGVAPAELARMSEVAQELAGRLRATGLRCEGVNLFLADGEAAGQEVFHVHLHVIPRFHGDAFRLRFGPGRPIPPRTELDDIAARIREARA